MSVTVGTVAVGTAGGGGGARLLGVGRMHIVYTGAVGKRVTCQLTDAHLVPWAAAAVVVALGGHHTRAMVMPCSPLLT